MMPKGRASQRAVSAETGKFMIREIKGWFYLEALACLRKRINAVAMPDANIVRKKVQLLSANWSEPLMPCPLVQPPAMRAPNMMMTPPRKADTNRFTVEPPNCCDQVVGTFSSRNVWLTNTLNRLPKNVPMSSNIPPFHLSGFLVQ